MKLLDRYIARQFFRTFTALVLGLPFLFIITDVTDNLDDYLARNLPTGDVALSYLYQLPQFIQWAFPIAALVATVFTIGDMTRHQEIAAAKAGGVSFYRLVTPILIFAAFLSVVALGLGELVPVTNQMRAEALGEQPDRGVHLRSNFVFKTEGGRVLSIRRLNTETSEMVDLVLEREASSTAPAIHQTAQRALWQPESGWTFEDGFLRMIGADGEQSTFAYEELRIPELEETPEELLAEPKEPDEMRYGEMGVFIRAIERSGGDADPLRVERAQKISLPLAVLVIVLFGAPLATSSKRGGAAYGIGISLAVTMVYLLLFKVGTAVGGSGAVDPLVAAWMPNVLFLLGGVFLLSRVRS
ncbi:MAG TPA: LptF/LptG family permease [Longimicrobiaceae bacterium]|nr:LptF/LptG family permease [Longimicrobiaceae bacterium]